MSNTQVTGWVKWGVLALIGIGAVVSLGSILMGRIFSHPHASRYGAMGVAVVVMVAIAYTVILVILDSITGSGCTGRPSGGGDRDAVGTRPISRSRSTRRGAGLGRPPTAAA